MLEDSKDVQREGREGQGSKLWIGRWGWLSLA
jgi:hypothetical protein